MAKYINNRHLVWLISAILFIANSCCNNENLKENNLIGTWEIILGKFGEDTALHSLDYTAIKTFTKTRFFVLSNRGDSLKGAVSGTYSTEGNRITEKILLFTEDESFIGSEQTFKFYFKDGFLFYEGHLTSDNMNTKWQEVWKRIE